jgi:molybdopterin synthase catalytic subunit
MLGYLRWSIPGSEAAGTLASRWTRRAKLLVVDVIRMLGISEAPLSVADAYASVSDEPSAGGIAIFAGVVRDEDHGRGISSLGYSAHPTAGIVLREVVEKAIGQYPIRAVSAVHRTGDLEIGEIAVIVAVATPSRAEAFEACHQIIDDIKTAVPIWKHQLFTDGNSEWVGAGISQGSSLPRSR